MISTIDIVIIIAAFMFLFGGKKIIEKIKELGQTKEKTKKKKN
jgi:Sec-independent protein translocase protein TatA